MEKPDNNCQISRHQKNCKSPSTANGNERLETKAIFRELIADEVRTGSLTPARRRRIIRYAAQLDLTAVQVGQLIEQCRDEMIQSDDPQERHQALKLVEPPPQRLTHDARIWLVVVLAILLDYILVRAIW